jgi:hypothetical protein
MENQYDYDDFWESLDDILEELFAEIDRMIASGWEKQQVPGGQHRLDNHPRVETDEQDEAGVVPRGVGKSREPDGLRRPQEEDEYWSTSPKTWSLTPYARREMLSHVGRINETSEGEEATDCDCTRCARSGAECMVYRHEVRIQSGDIARRACSRCIFRGLKCSFNTTGTNSGNKGKAATRGMGKFKQSQRTSSERRLRSSGTA